MPSESVDAVVTDPPFGIGFDYSGIRESTSTPESYWTWYAPIHAEYLRILRPGGFWAVWQSGKYHRHLWDWFGVDVHIYIAAKNFVQLRKTEINYAYDPVPMNYKSGVPLRPANPPRNLDFSVGNTAALVSDTTRLERGHPAPRPLDQVLHIVENFTLPGGTILDPFAGSGTTGIACVLSGRSFIGIEIVPEYLSIAQKRISDASLQTHPFIKESQCHLPQP